LAKSTHKAARKKAKPAPKAKASRPAARPAKSSKRRQPSKIKSRAGAKPAALKLGSSGPTMLKPMPVKSTRPAPVAKLSNSKSGNGKAAKMAPAIIPPPPPPRSKPGKNQAGMSTRELEVFRDALLAKRRELVGDMYSMEREALQRSGENLSNLPLHMADMGTDNYEQEFTLGLMEKDRQLLREINQALSKIMDGRYGICEGTGKAISKARLEVQPWAKYSIEHARKLENRGVR
jgi:DnaK suppressor protein